MGVLGVRGERTDLVGRGAGGAPRQKAGGDCGLRAPSAGQSAALRLVGSERTGRPATGASWCPQAPPRTGIFGDVSLHWVPQPPFRHRPCKVGADGWKSRLCHLRGLCPLLRPQSSSIPCPVALLTMQYMAARLINCLIKDQSTDGVFPHGDSLK